MNVGMTEVHCIFLKNIFISVYSDCFVVAYFVQPISQSLAEWMHCFVLRFIISILGMKYQQVSQVLLCGDLFFFLKKKIHLKEKD